MYLAEVSGPISEIVTENVGGITDFFSSVGDFFKRPLAENVAYVLMGVAILWLVYETWRYFRLLISYARLFGNR